MTFGKIGRHDLRRGRRAVASHPKNGPSNPSSFSRYIMNEQAMHHLERKEAVLPCGYKVHESWAALRISWQGFKIAKSNNDVQRMKHYAGFINKVQKELGIGVTMFDQELLDPEILSGTRDSAGNLAEEELASSSSSEEQVIEESLPDYDSILHADTPSATISTPRESIFVTYKDRPKGQCEYFPAKIDSETTIERHFYPQRSCPSPGILDSSYESDKGTGYATTSFNSGQAVKRKNKVSQRNSYAYTNGQDDQTEHKKVDSERHIYYNRSCPISDEIIESRKARKRRLKSCYYRT